MRRIGWKRRSESLGRLTAISAWELFQAQQEALLMTPSGQGFGLCLNACVLCRALVRRGRLVFRSGEAVLQALTEPQLRSLTEQYLERFVERQAVSSSAAVNPNFDEARFEELRRQ